MANTDPRSPPKRRVTRPSARGSGAAAGESAPAPATMQGVGLLVKTFQLLDLFTAERPSWSQVELLNATGLSRSTLSRLVRFLHARAYLAFVAGAARYTLGVAAVDLGRRAVRESNLAERCALTLAQLAEQTGETVMLIGYDPRQGKAICLEQIPSVREGLRVFERVGASFPLYRGASSKAILAFMAPPEVDAALAVMRHEAPDINAERLRRDLDNIRASGLATSLEETYPGVAGLAVPLLASDGLPLGSIAVAAPILRMNLPARTKIGKLLRASGIKLSASLSQGR